VRPTPTRLEVLAFSLLETAPELLPTHDELTTIIHPTTTSPNFDKSPSNYPSQWVPLEVSEPARAMRSAVITARRWD
jgi:hypothetical protein